MATRAIPDATDRRATDAYYKQALATGRPYVTIFRFDLLLQHDYPKSTQWRRIQEEVIFNGGEAKARRSKGWCRRVELQDFRCLYQPGYYAKGLPPTTLLMQQGVHPEKRALFELCDQRVGAGLEMLDSTVVE